MSDHLNTVRDIAKYDSQTDTTTVVNHFCCDTLVHLLYGTRNHLVYDAFGKVTAETNPAVDSLFLFTARPFDPDTGLQNNLNRWYDASVGRWLSEDPIGFDGGDGNLYRYVGNAPQSTHDPIGLQIVIQLPPPRPRPTWWPEWLVWPYDEQGHRESFQCFDPSDLVCPIAGVARKQALKTISSLARQIETHLGKIAQERVGSPVIAHWKQEGAAWIKRVETLLPCVGKKTAKEIEPHIKHWKDQLETLPKER